MKPAIRYSVMVCLLTWAFLGIVALIPGDDGNTFNIKIQIINTLIGVVMMAFPLVTAVWLQKRDGKKFNHTGLVNLKLSWTWLVALILPIVIACITLCINLLMPNVEYDYSLNYIIEQYHLPEEARTAIGNSLSTIPPIVLALIIITNAVFCGCTANALVAFGEEYGWRCYLVDALKGRKFFKVALFIGFVWGLWHAPLILMGHNYPNERVFGVFLMIIHCILLGVVQLYLVSKSKSVIPAAILHGTYNAIAALPLCYIKGGNDFVNGVTGFSGMIATALVIVAIFIFDRFVSKENIMATSI